MIRSRSFKSNFSLFLIFIFISPILIKGTHRLFVHHDHSSISNKLEITIKHKHCPICAFEFVEFIESDNQPLPDIHKSLCEYYPEFIKGEIELQTIYSFSLRAPPVIG